MFDYAYAWMMSFIDNYNVAYLMFEACSEMFTIPIMMYEVYLHLDDCILPYIYEIYELQCTRVDTALVITSGKTLFPMSALFGLQHEDTFNVDQGRYAYTYAFETNLLEAILLVSYFTKKGAIKIKKQSFQHPPSPCSLGVPPLGMNAAPF